MAQFLVRKRNYSQPLKAAAGKGFRAIVKNLSELGIPKDHILIVVRDSNKESWGVQGGQSGYDVDLGFKVEV